MNKITTQLFILLFISLFATGQVKNNHAIYQLEQKAHEKSMVLKTNDLGNNYNVIYHKIEWQVDPAVRYIQGSVSTLFESLSDSLNQVHFDLSNSLSIDSIYDNSGHLKFTHERDQLIIQLSDTLIKKQKDTLTICYQGAPEESGFGSFIISKHSGQPVLWTLSEPYGAKDWWPCKQNLEDKIDSLDIYVTVPLGNKVASNGLLMESQRTDTNVTHHWKHQYPIAYYLIAIAVSNYQEFTDYAQVSSSDSVSILNYVYPEYYDRYFEDAKYTIDLIELYSELFIPYPFYKEKYGHAQFGWGGGMEHQTMSFMSNFSQHLIAHELAHQWFGNHVTCGSWQDIWVNEGFAVFGEAIAQEYLHPDEWDEWIADRIGHVAANAQTGSVFVEDTSNLKRLFDNTLTYQKGGMVLHQLRHQIGDEAFFKGIKLMLNDGNKSGNTARTNDVRHYFEMAGDTILKDYFDQWVYGEGLPKFNVEIKQEKDFETTITLHQRPSSEKTLFFALKVPILFETDSGQFLMTFHQTTNYQPFTFTLNQRINNAVLDPHYTLITSHPANIKFDRDELLKDEGVIIAPNPAKTSITVTWDPQLLVDKFEIYSTKGKRVYHDTLNEYVTQYEIPIQKLKPGNYLLKTYTTHTVIVKKFIKE